MSTKKPDIDLSIIDTTPPEQHVRNHARADRILTFIEEKVFRLPALPSD